MSFINYLKEQRITFRNPCPYTREKNGVIGRKQRHIVEMGLTLLAQALIPLRYQFSY